MDKEAFKKAMEEFWLWTSTRSRPASVWFLSLRDWAEIEFNREYEKEYKAPDKR